jgi:pilus assembly protein CpaC
VVRAVAQNKLSRPDDGFADANDAQTVLLGRFNRIYGNGEAAANPVVTTTTRNHRNNYGFILD